MFFSRRHKRILIVDDNKDLLTVLSKILEGANYDVFSTTQGSQAVDLARAVRPDAIILDIIIPDLGGDEIERVLKIDSSTRNIPIIYMTALASSLDEENSHKPGKRRLLAKPVSRQRLLEAIGAVV